MDKTQQELISEEAFCRFIWHAYFEERRYDIIGEVVAEDVSVIGTGAHEVSRNLEEFAAAMSRESQEWNGSFIIKDEWYQTSKISDTYSMVIGEIVVREDAEDGILYDIRFRFTLLLEWDGRGWRLRHIHQSVPDANQTSDEFFPHHIVEKNEQQVIYNLRHDSMTGLLNRLYLKQKVNRFIMDQPAGVMLMMDIDKFKTMNDSYGHPFGDKVLIAFAQSLLAGFGRHVAGRIGGDEFVIYMPEIQSQEQLAPYLQEFQEDWAERQQPLKYPSEISVSMGVAFCPEHGQDYAELWKSADEALYRAKKSGLGKVCYRQ